MQILNLMNMITHTHTHSINRNIPYREAIGSLMFLTIVSRPDITYAVNFLSRYLNKYNGGHWQAVKRIFKYLKGTVNFSIEFSGCSKKNNFELEGYSDADFASDTKSGQSTTGYIFRLFNGPVIWSSQKQTTVALSTTESEYILASTAARDAVWLRFLMNDLKCDNKVAVAW